MKSENRITLDDSVTDAMVKMVDGNVGAITALVNVVQNGVMADPYCESFIYVLQLDTHGYYGSSIWVLWKDICRSDLATFIVVMRSLQYGFVSAQTVDEWIMTRSQVPLSMLTTLAEMVYKELPDLDRMEIKQ